jgi:hypothetical protein
MRNALALAAAIAIVAMNPVAAYASCGSFCTNHCANAHPNNPGARGACYGGCVAGCEAANAQAVEAQG